VLVGDFAAVLIEVFQEEPTKVLAAASAGLRQEQQGLFDKIIKLVYMTREEKARAVSVPVMAHSNLGGDCLSIQSGRPGNEEPHCSERGQSEAGA
jgi:hypothetical protein